MVNLFELVSTCWFQLIERYNIEDDVGFEGGRMQRGIDIQMICNEHMYSIVIMLWLCTVLHGYVCVRMCDLGSNICGYCLCHWASREAAEQCKHWCVVRIAKPA
jgi:hypothetical protein